jgi:hypothetical protein
LLGKASQVIAVGAEVIIDDIQNDTYSKPVRAVYEAAEIVRTTI